MTRHEDVQGTMAELVPQLKARGLTRARVLSGTIAIEDLDPYGCGYLDSVNVRKAEDVWRGVLCEHGGRWYLTDLQVASAPFFNGLYPLE